MKNLIGLCLLLLLCSISAKVSAQDSLLVTVTQSPTANDPILISIRGHAGSGIDRVRLQLGGDLDSVFYKEVNADDAVWDTTIYQPYQGSQVLHVSLIGTSMDTTIFMEVGCNDQICDLDPIMVDFFQWAREAGYPECLLTYYINGSSDPLTRNGTHFTESFKSFTRLRGVMPGNDITIKFYQIIPLDPGSTYLSLTQTPFDTCEAHPIWSNWCSSPSIVDTALLRWHFETALGVNVTFDFTEIHINYTDTFGIPDTLPGGLRFEPDSMSFWATQFDEQSIIYWAIDSLNGYKAIANDGAPIKRAHLQFPPRSALVAGNYTHEWMHTLGFAHGFTQPPGSNRKRFTLDGIMINSYFGGTRDLIDPLDPLERYAMEPVVGEYINESTFVQEYTQKIFDYGNWLGDTCKGIDLVLNEAKITNSTSQDITFEITVSNSSELLTGFVSIGFIDGDGIGTVVHQVLLEYMIPDSLYTFEFTIQRSDFPSGQVTIKIDPEDIIVEENEFNNSSCDYLIILNPLKLVGNDREDESRFGWSVELSDSFVVIGAQFTDHNDLDSFASNGGRVAVYRLESTGWTFMQNLYPANWTKNGYFGVDVDIFDETIVVGASGTGTTHIFTLTGNVWVEDTVLLPAVPTLNSGFGLAVAIWDTMVIVGAPYEDDVPFINNGAVYFFASTGGVWSQTSRVIAADADAWDYFGNSVDIWQGRAITGAPGDENGRIPAAAALPWAGSAYIMERNPLGWFVVEKVIAQDRDSHETFGWSVAIFGDAALVGANTASFSQSGSLFEQAGAAYAFGRFVNGNWRKRGKIIAPDADEFHNFGSSVSIYGRRAVIGAASHDNSATVNSGAAYIMTRNNNLRWKNFNRQLLATDFEASDRFGVSSAIWNECVIVGSPYEDHDEYGCSEMDDDGAAYLFCFSNTNPPAPFTDQDEDQSDEESDEEQSELSIDLPRIKVFPNPTEGFVSVQYNGEVACTLEVQNTLGQVVLQTTIEPHSTTHLDISNIKPGLLFLRTNTGLTVQKLVLKK